MSERRVWVAQCLCPQQHAILAASAEADSEEAAQAISRLLREHVTKLLHDGLFNAWCGICHAASKTWRYELGRTRFVTMADAESELRRLERENIELGSINGRTARDRARWARMRPQ